MDHSRRPGLNTGLLAAAALAGTAYWVRQSAKKAELKSPPIGKFIEVDGVRLHYLEYGAGPPVLLVHGANVQAADFLACRLIEKLATRYRVIAFDRPGYGYSERPRGRVWSPKAQALLLERACAALAVKNPIVLGHSFGTLVALSLALDTALPVRGLVLTSGYYFPTPRLDVALFSPPAIPLVGDVMRYTVSPWLGRLMMPSLLRRIFSPKEVDPHFLQAVPPPMMLRPSQLKAVAADSAFMLPAAARLSRRYRELRPPLEIVAGTEDAYVDQRQQSARLHELLPASRLVWVRGGGHMLHYGMSGTIAEAVDRAGGRGRVETENAQVLPPHPISVPTQAGRPDRV
jgi:pimeloyl-ACP methyl ester carboxylesterase